MTADPRQQQQARRQTEPPDEPGTRSVAVAGVVVRCMEPHHRDLLDAAVAAWNRDYPGQEICRGLHGPYSTLYWLFRHSGIDFSAVPSLPSSEDSEKP